MDLKTAIVDQTYNIIRDRFQHKGKGRPRALPKQIIRNNRILVQLSYLREEGNHPWSMVLDKWIPDIFPETIEVNGSTDRFRYMIDKVRQSYTDTALEPGSLEDFLNKDINLNFISESCTSVGINRTNFSTPPCEMFDPPIKIINQVVIDLEKFRISQALCKKYVILWINASTGLNKDKLPYVIMSCYKNYTSLHKNAKSNPAALLDVEFKSVFQNIFHSSYHQSDVYDAVHVFIHQCDESFLLNVLTKLCEEALNVSKRQLGDFLNTGYFTNLSQSDCEQLRHCSLNNLIGESSFGDLDFDISKRRHTTLHNRSATHCVRRNRTVQFFLGKSISHQSRLFSKARKLSRVLKKESVAAEQQVKLNVRTKFISNQDKKIQKEIKVIAKRSLLRDKVTKHGGPCQTSQDVDELLHRLNIKNKSQAVIREIIKNEIRYHKTVLGRRGLQFGSLDVMTTMLKSELQR